MVHIPKLRNIKAHDRWRSLGMSSCFTAVSCIACLAAVGMIMSCSKQSTEPEPKSLVAVDYAWVELGPEGKILARAITPPGECPSIQLDTNTRQMQRRSLTPPPGFEAIQVCEFELPAGTRSASINGQNLAIPSRQPKQIVVLGDTGCRIKGTDIQNCTGLGSGPAWNFHQVAETIAALEPDLIIHVAHTATIGQAGRQIFSSPQKRYCHGRRGCLYGATMKTANGHGRAGFIFSIPAHFPPIPGRKLNVKSTLAPTGSPPTI